MTDLSFVGWLTLAAAALLAWVALRALWLPWRLCASLALAVLVAFVMLHPPEAVLVEPEAAAPPEAARAPPTPVAARKAAPAAAAPEAAASVEPPAADPCAALAGLQKEQCGACGASAGLTRALCEGAARSRYCSDKTGRDPDCPATSVPSDPA